MQESGTTDTAAKAQPVSTGSLTTPGPRALPNGLEIKGLLKFSQDLLFEGTLEGEVHSGGTFTVGESAKIKADIKSRSIVVFGNIEGNITVQERCVLKDTAVVIGDITAAKLAMDGGAVFVGQSKAPKR
jgi:cytoskeletal protein CcmA (bactofilin family)